MQGTYKIRIGDKVYEYQNVITTVGKYRILDSVSGKTSGFAGAVAAGIGTTAATVNDKALEYLVGGGDVANTIADYINGKIYLKATLPTQDQYEIRELGCFATNYSSVESTSTGGSILLVVFGSSTPWTDITGTSSIATTNNRFGVSSIQYSINATNIVGRVPFIRDFSELPSNSTFDFAYYANNLSSFLLRFKVDDSNYYEGSYPVTNGYNIKKVQKASFIATGTPDWTNINSIEVAAASTATDGLLSLDLLRYSIPNTQDSILLSRAVLTTPKVKLAGVSMDIEYVLSLGL